MSDLSTMIKRLLLPVIISTAALPVQANTVRIIGPSAGEQAVAVSQPEKSAADSSSRGRTTITRYGPTTNDETLWSIASRYRPNNQVSVYQVIGAIHRANPQAFEQNNIHGLLPGSTLVMPTLAQIRQEDIDSVKRRLEVDQRRKSRQIPAKAPRPAATTKAATSTPEPTTVAKPLPKPETASEQVISQPKTASEAVQPPATDTPKGGIPAKPAALQQQLEASDEQITKLLESNHLLRVRLAEMQHEVTALKEQISDDDVLREQIKDFIQQQRTQLPQPVVQQETWFDSLIASPWSMAALAFIPGSLIAGALAFFMLRRRKEDDDVKSLQGPEGQPPAMVSPPEQAQEATPELAANEKDDDIDDLFGNDEESLFDDPENSLFAAETDLGADQQSDSIDILDLSTDENDEFEIDSGLSTSSISVKGDEQAIGLQDMERALDEMEQASEPSSDESLAAMWEQSLQDDADAEESFDLSDDNLSDELINDSMPDQAIEDGLLDQSILDDLLSEVEAENQAEESLAFSPEPVSTDAVDTGDTGLAKDDDPQQVVGQDELDSLFDAVAEAPAPDAEAAVEAEELAQQAAVDQALAEADSIFSAEADALDESELDALFDENSTSLLDELIEEDELTSDIEIEENSTALLDELLGDNESSDSLLNPDVSIDENSTALLDELVEELDSDMDGEQDETAHLFGRDHDEYKEGLDVDDVVIDEGSTELLDDILDRHSNQPAEEPVVENQVADVMPETEEPARELSDSVLSEPEFEPAEDVELSGAPSTGDGKPLAFDEADEIAPAAEQEPLLPDEDFPEPAVFEDIFQDALEENKDDIDAILADVDDLLDEPLADEGKGEDETGDVENLERSVDELLESFESEQNGLQQESSPVIDEVAVESEAIQPEIQPDLAPSTPGSAADELEESVLGGIGEDEFPVFGEEEALAEAEPEPESSTEPLETAFPAEDTEPLNLEELPEFDEEAAFNDPEAENLEQEASLLTEDEEQAALENIVKQLQQAAEAAEKPYKMEDADDSVVATAPEPVAGADSAEMPQASIHGEQSIEFETIDPDSLPEFSENDALQASFDEQHELEQYELEQGLKAQPEVSPSPYQAQQPADMFDDEMVDSAGLDMAALLSDPEAAVAEPEVAENIAAEQSERLEPEEETESAEVTEPAKAMELDDADFVTSPESAFDAELEAEEFGAADEPVYHDPASQGEDSERPEIAAALAQGSQEELDAEREQLLSDAFDESSESGESLVGLEGAEFDIPEEDSAIWAATSPEPELETEDWAEQPQMQIEDVDAFDTEMLLAEAESQALPEDEAGSELVDEPVSPSSYISIDELMKEMELEDPVEQEEQPLNLEVGLDEFPDVLSGVETFDVDSQGEYASKLDLAKAYLEMNDTEGAWGLLQEVADNGDAQSKREAKGLLAKIGG